MCGVDGFKPDNVLGGDLDRGKTIASIFVLEIFNRQEMRGSTPVTESVNALSWPRKQIETGDADLLREMIKTFTGALMGAEIDGLCVAGRGAA